MTVVGLSAKKVQARPRPDSRVVPDLSLWNQLSRVGGGLTPVQVSGIIREADGGNTTRLMDLANDARQKDGTLQAVLSQSEEAIGGLDWQLQLPAKPKAKEKRATEWIDGLLRGNASFSRLIAHLAGAVYYGYAVSEILWTKTSGRLVPADYVCLAPRRFGFRSRDGLFVLRDEGTKIDGVDVLDAFPNKFVVSRPRVTGDVPCREGLVRVLMWAALFRNWTMSDWLRTGEIAWKPWRIGTYKPGTSEESVDNLIAVLDGMSSNGVAVVPDTTTLDVKWAPNGSGKTTHAELFETIGREMTKAVLGQTETTQSSTSSGYAQAKVHNEVRKDLRESRARCVAADITRDVIRPLIELNFGPGMRVPRMRFVTDDSLDFKAFSEGIKNLVDAGTRIPQSWVREEAGIPDPTGDEEILGAAEETSNGSEEAIQEDDGAEAEEGTGDESWAPSHRRTPDA